MQVEIPTKQTGILGGLGGNVVPPVGSSSEILNFFRELRAFLEVPIVDTVLRQKFGLTDSTKATDSGSMKLQRVDTKTGDTIKKGGEKTENTKERRDYSPDKTPEELVIEQLATKEGRKSLADGIKNIIKMTGDVKLSEVIELLTSEDIKGVKK